MTEASAAARPHGALWLHWLRLLDEADVEALLKQLRDAKQRELRLRAERKRVRAEIETLRAEPLWTREKEAQRQLESIQRERETLRSRQQRETETLEQLNQSLRTQEMSYRRKASPKKTAGALDPERFKAEAIRPGDYQVIAEKNKMEHRSGGAKTKDSLQSLMEKIDCNEQLRRVEKLRADLQNADARRKANDFQESPAINEARRIPGSPPENLPLDSPHPTRAPSRNSPVAGESGSDALDRLQKCTGRSSSVRSGRQSLTERVELPRSAGTQSIHAPGVQTSHPALAQPAPWFAPSPSIYVPAPGYSYPPLLQPLVPPGMYNPYNSFLGSPAPYQYLQPYPVSNSGPWSPFCSPQSASYALHGAVNPVYAPNGYVPQPAPVQGVVQGEEEVIRQLERQIEAMKASLPNPAASSDVARLQTRVNQLRHKVTEFTSEAAQKGESPREGSDHGDDPALMSLKRQHLQAIIKVRNERDLLEEQEKLEDLKEEVNRRRVEKKREQDHTEWLARQKRELVELRLQRTLARGSQSALTGSSNADSDDIVQEMYSPESGLTLFWDDVVGVRLIPGSLQITYAVFEGTLLRTSFRAVPAKDVEGIGPTTRRYIFRSNRHIAKLTPSRHLKVVMEVSSISSEKNETGKQVLVSVGWAVMELFIPDPASGELAVCSGFFKLPLRNPPMPDPSRASINAHPYEENGNPFIRARVVLGNKAEDESCMSVDPQLFADRYRLPHEAGSGSEVHRQSRSTLFQTNERDPVVAPAKSPPKPSRSPDLEQMSKSLSSTDADREPAGSVESIEADTPWIQVDKAAERNKRASESPLFQAGGGFNVLVDAARCLPDNVSITKVTVAALNSDRTRVEALDAVSFSSRVADVYNPVFDLYVEFQEKRFNPTLTIVIRIDTIDIYSKLPVILGYCVFPAFIDAETRAQPLKPAIERFRLNEGGFQLPLRTYLSFGTAEQEFRADALESVPSVPCATLLMRITQAKRTQDGLTLQTRKNWPPEQWEAKGLVSRPPRYHDKAYDTMACVPTAMEQQIYALRHSKRKPRTVDECLQQLAPPELPDIIELLKPKPKASLDLARGFVYQSTIGFRVAIDGLHNVKGKAGSLFKVLYSVFPPGSFYQTPRVGKDVYFTASTDWTTAQTSPEFTDGFVTMRDHASASNVVALIIDVRSIARNAKTGAFASQPYGWTFLPVLSESGTVAIGAVQLPLFQGEVKLDVLHSVDSAQSLRTLVEAIASGAKSAPVTFVDGASAFVRLEDPQVPSIALPALTNTSLSPMVPKKGGLKYVYDAAKVAALKKKAPLSKLLAATAVEQEAEREINQAFAQVMEYALIFWSGSDEH